MPPPSDWTCDPFIPYRATHPNPGEAGAAPVLRTLLVVCLCVCDLFLFATLQGNPPEYFASSNVDMPPLSDWTCDPFIPYRATHPNPGEAAPVLRTPQSIRQLHLPPIANQF